MKTNEFSFCGKTFQSTNPSQKQGATHETTFEYSDFGKEFELSRNSKRDICNSIRVQSYQCVKCFKTFRKKFALDTHIKTHFRKLFECSVCGKILPYNSVTEIESHSRVHAQEEEETPYNCSFCSKRYKSKKSLTVHIRRVHKKKQLHTREKEQLHTREKEQSHAREKEQLPDCENVIQEDLDTTTKNPVEDRPFKCPLCHKTFAFNSSLKTHAALTHNKDQGSQIGSTFSQSVQCFKHGGMQHSVHNNPQGVNSLLANGLTFEKAPLTIPANVNEGSLRTDHQNMYEFPHIFHVKVEENDSDQC